SKKVELKTLPAVVGSAHCPFCSSSIPRAKLSAHLLRCKKLRRSQTCPKPKTGPSPRISGTDAFNTTTIHEDDKASTASFNGGGIANNNSSNTSHKVRCPHCLHGFSPAVAPTHISICARVENRPKGSGIAKAAAASKDDAQKKVALGVDYTDASPPGGRKGLAASHGSSGARRLQQQQQQPEKARVMPPFY
ncbi:unnamed protein product, partial [Ectocarpus sp. 13 AM-2016]